MEPRVEEIFETKDEWVLTVGRDDTIGEAVRKMVENTVGSVIVVEDGEPVGIFTERDYIRKVVLEEEYEDSDPVEPVMTPDVICVDPSYTIRDCMAIMTAQRCRHLPMMRDGQLSGMVSIGDCAKRLSEDAKVTIRHLEDYITGEYPR